MLLATPFTFVNLPMYFLECSPITLTTCLPNSSMKKLEACVVTFPASSSSFTEQSVAMCSLWKGALPIVTCIEIIQSDRALSKPMPFDSVQAHDFDRAWMG